MLNFLYVSVQLAVLDSLSTVYLTIFPLRSIEEANADVKKNVPFGVGHFVLKGMFVNI